MTPTTTWAWWKAHDNMRRFIDARCTRCNEFAHIRGGDHANRTAAEQHADAWCRDHRCEAARMADAATTPINEPRTNEE